MRASALRATLFTAGILLVLALTLTGCQDLGGEDATTSLPEAATTTAAPATTAGPATTVAPATTAPPAVVTTAAPPPVTTATTEAPTLVTTRFEEDDPLLEWAGSWTFTGGADDSGGSCRYTEEVGASVTAAFTGVSFSLITRTGLAVGELTITLDSGSPITVDCYSATPGYQQIVWAADPLEMGTHYVKIECAGTANPASGGTGVYIDAFAITGTLE
jgi:hypothetical protein